MFGITHFEKWLDRTVGSAFVGLGIRLATATR
ncbi:hypothetical protein CBA19C8_00865 [Paraburkholderia terrae]|nr:hypothetical protein CBA19C8_00865 [Paraburkholderia terrae]